MEPAVEQRKHRRHSANFQGIFASETVRGEEGVVLDLSLGGCRVASSTLILPDSTIQLQIRSRQAAPIYIPSVVVRWAGDSAFGVRFEKMPAYESKALTRLLQSLPA